MRKPREYYSELKTLADKAKRLKERQVRQLGELVIACRADALDIDALAGALLAAASGNAAVTKEGWRKARAAFFRGSAGSAARRPPSPAPGATRAASRRTLPHGDPRPSLPADVPRVPPATSPRSGTRWRRGRR